jgi:predicted PurR-regulated permease PerM
VLRPFLFAAVIVLLLKPILEFLEGRGMNRILALALTYVFFFLVLTVVMLFLVPIGVNEINQLIKAWPGYQKDVTHAITNWQVSYRAFSLPPQATKAIDAAFSGAQATLLDALSRVPSYTVSFISLMLDFVLAPLIAFFLLKDRAAISHGFFRLVPEAWRPESKYLTYRVNVVIQDVLRIMLVLAVIVSIAASIGLLIGGIPYALLLGFVAGFLQIIPYIGPVAGTIPAVIVAWVTKNGWWALGVAVYFTILTQVASTILAPVMMKDRIGVNPVLVLFILLLFGALFGFWGVVLAVPSAAIINEIAAFALLTEDERAAAIHAEGIPTD